MSYSSDLLYTNSSAICMQVLKSAYRPKEGFFSKVNIAVKNKSKFIPTGFLNTSTPENFRFYLGKRDVYICKNGMKKSGSWKKNNLSTLHNIVIDIDCHDDMIPLDGVKSSAVLLVDLLRSENIFPNFINITGRGMQIWFFVEPLPMSMEEYYTAVAQKLVDRITGILHSIPAYLKEHKLRMSAKQYNSYNLLKKFSVDTAASLNTAGLVRFPGSYNTRVGRYGVFCYLHDSRIDILDEFFYWSDDLSADQQPSEEKKITDKKEYTTNKKNPVSNRQIAKNRGSKIQGRSFVKNGVYEFTDIRENMIHHLIEMRRENGESTNGMRDLYMLILTSAYVSTDQPEEDTLAAMRKLNHVFDTPMNWNTVLKFMSTARRKKYFYSNAKIIAVLQMTEEEQRALCFYSEGIGEDSADEYRARRIRRIARNEQIIEMYQSGATQVEIAKEMDVAQSTVCRVLNKNGLFKKVKKTQKKDNTSKKHGRMRFMRIFAACLSKIRFTAENPVVLKSRNRKAKSLTFKNMHFPLYIINNIEPQGVSCKHYGEPMVCQWRYSFCGVPYSESEIIGRVGSLHPCGLMKRLCVWQGVFSARS